MIDVRSSMDVIDMLRNCSMILGLKNVIIITNYNLNTVVMIMH